MGVDLTVILTALACGIAQLQARLGEQGVERDVEGMAHVEVFAFFAQVRRAQTHRKQGAAQGLKNLRHCLAGRQFAATMLATKRPLRVRHWSRAPRSWLTMVCNCQ